jgi:hypothetical protein
MEVCESEQNVENIFQGNVRHMFGEGVGDRGGVSPPQHMAGRSLGREQTQLGSLTRVHIAVTKHFPSHLYLRTKSRKIQFLFCE